MTNGIAMIIDALVAVLLMLTIGYCMLLNRRLKLLKADEQLLRATISELVTATEIAERAIGGLKLTVGECESGMAERLRRAERVTVELDRSIAAGQSVLERLSQIVAAGGGGKGADANPASPTGPAGPAPAQRRQYDVCPPRRNAVNAPRHDAKALAAAAQAFAERLRMKVYGFAA